MFIDVGEVYLHREPVDFRKSINGLSIIVESDMVLSPLSGALFVFCNKKRDKLKLLYWDRTGFALWYRRMEGAIITLTETQLHWLLDGYDITKMQPHAALHYQTLL